MTDEFPVFVAIHRLAGEVGQLLLRCSVAARSKQELPIPPQPSNPGEAVNSVDDSFDNHRKEDAVIQR